MSNAETPAESQGGNTATPSTGALVDLPPRIRVHALAKLVGATSKQVLVTLAEMGETTRSAQSSVSRDVAHRVASVLAPAGPATPDAEQPEPAAPAAEQQAEQQAEPAPQEAEALEQPSELVAAAPQVPLFAAPTPMFLPPEPIAAPKAAKSEAKSGAKSGAKSAVKSDKAQAVEAAETDADTRADAAGDDDASDGGEDGGARRRRRRGRRGRGRGKGGDEGADSGTDQPNADANGAESANGEAKDAKPGKAAQSERATDDADQDDDAGASDESDADSGASRRRRRRRRRRGGSGEDGTGDDPADTVVHVRDAGRSEAAQDQVRSVRGSTRLEAKRQRRRDGREAGRRRAPILSESEFLARRESVERTMVVKETSATADRTTQIGVLEDGVLVEHFVTSAGSGSIVGNVYLGRVQNVLPSMEAAFVDIGRGRNAVLYAGEVDWDAAGLEGKSRKIEQALSSGDSVLVQVTKDPVGHKGARLTTQISLPGRYLVFVPGGGATGISRKLPENERRRLKDILKRIVPDEAGVIIRTASEGISEEELERDVRRLQSQWETIKEKSDAGTAAKGKKGAPKLLYEEPDLLVKVVRDLFTEDFGKLVIQGSVAWETINSYVQHVAPDLAGRLERYVGTGDAFTDYRINEQITKALDRKVWLPSGGYLVIDRTEAMTVIDVNTGKFTGSGGNLEETVTRNNLESAEEIVRQLRLRDIGGIIVIDFIDMVLESNRDLVLRRLTECLARDRTRHQVAEVTSLGLVQMTRKRVGTGLLEAFSNTCEHCKGRGVMVSTDLRQVVGVPADGDSGRRRAKGKADESKPEVPVVPEPTPEQRESVVTAVQVMANASKAVATKGATASDDAQPPGEGKPAAGESKPAAGESKPAAGESKPAAGESKPAAEESKRPARKRARRAASRPAGPPVGASASPAGTDAG